MEALPTAGGITVPVRSMQEIRFSTTVGQQYDFSCGSAALATLLTYHYEDKVPESEIFVKMFQDGDQVKIRKEGFSLLDMKNYLTKRGYQADGYQIPLEKLRILGVPAIVLITVRGYKHFVVVKGVDERAVLLGDPALGSKAMPRPEFEQCWNGLVFIIKNKKDVASRHFNVATEWPVRGHMGNLVPLTDAQLLSPTLYLSIVRGL
jgi:predicted double-glycine peptidase